MATQLQPETYKGWRIEFLKYGGGMVRALGYKNGRLYTQHTGYTKDESFRMIKHGIDQFGYMPGYEKRVTPLNNKAWRKHSPKDPEGMRQENRKPKNYRKGDYWQ